MPQVSRAFKESRLRRSVALGLMQKKLRVCKLLLLLTDSVVFCCIAFVCRGGRLVDMWQCCKLLDPQYVSNPFTAYDFDFQG
jgi:hypothetical protein